MKPYFKFLTGPSESPTDDWVEEVAVSCYGDEIALLATKERVAIVLNGYVMCEACGADVLGDPQARLVASRGRALYTDPDHGRARLTNDSRVWMADIDRGKVTAWSTYGGDLARYVDNFPPI